MTGDVRTVRELPWDGGTASEGIGAVDKAGTPDLLGGSGEKTGFLDLEELEGSLVNTSAGGARALGEVSDRGANVRIWPSGPNEVEVIASRDREVSGTRSGTRTANQVLGIHLTRVLATRRASFRCNEAIVLRPFSPAGKGSELRSLLLHVVGELQVERQRLLRGPGLDPLDHTVTVGSRCNSTQKGGVGQEGHVELV